jgi:hypothetical protein
MGGHNDEAGESPALSRNCNLFIKKAVQKPVSRTGFFL